MGVKSEIGTEGQCEIERRLQFKLLPSSCLVSTGYIVVSDLL